MSATHDELLQRVLEGEASESEQARLAELLERDPSLRLRRDELKRAFDALAAARLGPAPEGLKVAVLEAIAHRGRGPEPSTLAATRTGRRSTRGAWLRLVLPATAAIAAVAVLWLSRGPWERPGGTVSGAFGPAQPTPELRLGEGGAAVVVIVRAAERGFVAEVRTGDTPGEIEVVATGGTRISLDADPAAGGAAEVRQSFGEHARLMIHGGPPDPRHRLQVTVRLDGGRRFSGEVPLPADRSNGPVP